jgi:putative spermidine/putrescine transport system substrate-binding protein
MVDPYVAMGAKVTLDESTDYAKIKTMVESNNVTWDVVDADPFFPIANCGKYAEKLDTTVIDTSKMDKALVSECAVPAMTYSYILAYNPEKYSTPPSGWADFFDTAKFPGKRALQNAVQGGAYEVALLADGVAPDALYPIDYDRAFKKLDTIKKDLVYWDKGAQSQEMAEKGEVDMMLIWNGRAFNAAKAGSKMKPAWKQSITVYDVFMIPKGSKNKDAAMRFIAYATGKEPQERLAQNIPYAPIHADAKPVVDELTKAYLPSENADGAVVQDQKWYSENETEATKRWEAYVAG